MILVTMILVQVVEELGEQSNGACAKLEIMSCHEEFRNHYRITEYDGVKGYNMTTLM